MISISGAGEKKVFSVTVPPGIRDGTILRLAGIGRREDTGKALDGYIKILIEPPAAGR